MLSKEGRKLRVNCSGSVLSEKQGNLRQALRLCEICFEYSCRLSESLFCFCHICFNLHVISLASFHLNISCLSFQEINSFFIFLVHFSITPHEIFLELCLFCLSTRELPHQACLPQHSLSSLRSLSLSQFWYLKYGIRQE